MGRMTELQETSLLDEIAAYCKRRGISATAFGSKCLGDPNFVHDISKGREPRRRTVRRVREFIANE